MALELPFVWYSAGVSAASWGAGGTYKRVPYDALPDVGPLDGSFAWLRAERRLPYGTYFGTGDDDESHDAPEDDLRDRMDEARALGLPLPGPFVDFVLDPELAPHLPAPTAWYYELGARLIAVPGHDGPERLLRFLMDQQAVLIWYLLLEPKGNHRVVVARPEWTDADDPETFEDAATPVDLAECAPSFEAFVRRAWIENTLQDEADHGGLRTPELIAYAAAARDAVDRGLLKR